jgi:lipoprotein-releasing system permease protein
MGYPLTVALRYLASKKRNMVSISTALAIGGVVLGVAALTIVMSVTGGFQEQFREKVLGVNAHVLVLKYSIDFREYRDVMKKVEGVPHVTGVAPFVINPMMVTHGDRTATGVLLKGVDPGLMPTVLDLPKHVVEGSLDGLRRAGAKPPERAIDTSRRDYETPHTSLSTPDRPGASDGSGRGGGGGSDRSDAGTDSLLAMIQHEVEEEMKLMDAGARPDAAGERAAAPPPPPAPTPMGKAADLTPAGGYKSQLPEDDFIPDAVDPDPCKSRDQVARMPGIVVGRTLSKQLDVKLGDCVQVTSPQIGLSFGGARPPIAKQFRVISVFEAGFDQYDSKLVYTDLYEAQDFYEYGDSVTGIEMKLDDIDKSDAVAKTIAARLNNGLYNTMTWQQLNHGLFTALLFQQIGMSFVLGLIILIAACTVIATLIMVVMEKKKEIALLKAIGATNGAVMRIFLYQGAMIGVAGTALGVSIGWVCCRFLIAYAFPLDPKVYFISKLPVSMHAGEFIIPALIALAICIDATILPALHAAEMRPSDGLRDEPADDLSSWRVREVIRAAWGAFGRQWWLLCTALLTSAVVVGGAAYGATRGLASLIAHLRPGALLYPGVAAVPPLAGLTLGLLLNAFFQAGLLRMWCAVARGERTGLGQLFGGGDRFLPLVAALVLRALVVMVGLACLILPGILLALGLSLTEFFVVDRRMSPVAALRASWDASVGKKGRLMLYLAGGGMLILAGYLAAGVGAVVAVSVVWIGLAVIYLNTPGSPASPPPQLDRPLIRT